jgi:hypothetical protein
MIWGKRTIQGVGYVPYFDRLEKLMMANPTRYAEFIMVSVKIKALLDDYYVGVPESSMMALFDGFEPVLESDLPKIIDTLHIADATKEPFSSRFTFRHRG